MPSADFCPVVNAPYGAFSLLRASPSLGTGQTSRGKFDRFRRTTAGFTPRALDGYGLRDHWPARPARHASDPVLVHRPASLPSPSFRRRLTTTPLGSAILHL